jgi:type VI protein secretion system component Hcp
MAFDTYICFPEASNIKGEAGTVYAIEAFKRLGKPIQLTSWSGLGAEMATTVARSDVGGATTGRSKVKNFSCEANLDKSGGSIAFHSAAGTVFSKVELRMFISVNDEKKGGQIVLRILSINLYDVIITSYSISIGGGDDLPTMSFELSIGRIAFGYKGLDPKTRTSLLSTPDKFTWSTLSNSEDSTIDAPI